LGLPTFDFHGKVYFKRITLIVSEGRIEAALYPVFPPDKAADQALAWLAENPSS
jgi:peroxiredoxin